MLYPSKYVLVTDKDTCCHKKDASESKKCVNSDSKSYRLSEVDDECSESSALNFCDGIHKSAAGVLPERIWQDSIMNPAYTNAAASRSEQEKVDKAHSENNIENSINAANGIDNSSSSSKASDSWNFAEPNHKANCSCTRQVVSRVLSVIKDFDFPSSVLWLGFILSQYFAFYWDRSHVSSIIFTCFVYVVICRHACHVLCK